MPAATHDYNLLMIERELVEKMNIESPLQSLKAMAIDAACARQFANRVGICFEGYEDDGEVYQDAKVRAYVQALTERFPYWLHFASKEDDTLFVILNCLEPPQLLDGGAPGKVRVAIDGAAWNARILNLFGHMNELYQRLGLSAAENSIMSKLVGAWLDRTLR